jgi:hypothetical protein
VKFVLLLYGNEAAWADASPEDLKRSMDAYAAFDAELKEAGAIVAGEGLEASGTATTVRLRDGEPLLTDGPFAETREQLGGFYVLECKDRDEAVAWAQKVPDLAEGSVEVRPVIDYEALGYSS